jgi:hypothetical protein
MRVVPQVRWSSCAPTASDGVPSADADHTEHLEAISSDGQARRVLTHGISADANPAWRPSS